MNSANANKKKLTEYQIEDIKELFVELFRKISSKVVLLEIGNDFINIALAKSQKNRLYIKKVLRQNIPSEALDKCIIKHYQYHHYYMTHLIKLLILYSIFVPK